MKTKKFYVLLPLVSVLMLISGASFNGKASFAGVASVQESLQASQRMSLSQEIQAQSNLAHSPSVYSGYTRVTDYEDKIMMQVPVEWNDIETGTWTYKGKNVGVFVAASSDLANFYSNRSQPGVFIGVSHALAQAYGKKALLDIEKRDHSRPCGYNGRFNYQNLFYAGQYDHFTNCAAGAPGLLVFTTASADQKSLILLRIVVASQADIDAAATIFNTFQVLGDPEHNH